MGFFDLAIAAPSMKAALEAWGSNSNLFHQGFAKETDDPAVVAATMANPGIVLQRPVGTSGSYREHAHLPPNLAEKPGKNRNDRAPTSPTKPGVDNKAARQAALAYEKEHRAQERARQKQAGAEAKKRERREQAVEKARAALAAATQEHEAKTSALENERASLEGRIQQEEIRWGKLKERLEGALRKAGG